jgi:hypothetical protein
MKRDSWIYVGLAGLAALVFGIYKWATHTPAHQSKSHMQMMSEKAAEAKRKREKEEQEKEKEDGNTSQK